MGQRSNNRKGWGGGGSSTPDSLTAAYPFAQIYIGAGAFTSAVTDSAIFVPGQQIGAAVNDTEDCWAFDDAAQQDIYARWSFANLPINLTDPQFKIFPEFKQNAVVSKPNPAEFGIFEYSIGVNADGNDSVYLMDGTLIAAASEVEAEFVSFAVGTGTATKSVALTTISGDGLPLNSINKNNIRFRILRTPGEAGDTFANEIFFYGMAVQFKTDFNNVAQWDV